MAPRALKGNSSGGGWSLVLRKDRKKKIPGKSFLVSNSFSPAAVALKRRSGFSTAVPMSSMTSFSPVTVASVRQCRRSLSSLRLAAGEPAFESDLPKHDNAGAIGSLLTPEARVAATAG